MNLYIEKHLELSFGSVSQINDCFRSLGIDYPRFFKMDSLSKLGFLLFELLQKDTPNRFEQRDDIAIVCFNRSSSLTTDIEYQNTISDKNFFPSPSLFVYTLPNIVAGEIAIRNNLCGETSFYLLDSFDSGQITRIASNVFFDNRIDCAIVAWIESFENMFEARAMFVSKQKTDLLFNRKVMEELYR